MKRLSLDDLEIITDAREDDSINSWVSAKSYKTVLEEARATCPDGRHIATLKEYMQLWLETVQEGGSRACNEADIWFKFQSDRDESNSISLVRHPYKCTVLVDTYLKDFEVDSDGKFSATVVDRGKECDRVVIPQTGKIYQLNHFGIPSRTGGRKTKESDPFEHRWWAFSSEEIRSRLKRGSNMQMALFANGGTIGCFCELVKAHYSMQDSGGFYRILTVPTD